jgi:leader peptidase (prepilin peptidase)/N-methyltransferase
VALVYMLGLAVGLGLNLCADWLPGRTAATEPQGAAPGPGRPLVEPDGRGHTTSLERGGAALLRRGRAVRWAVLAVLSTALCVYLQRRYGWGLPFVIQVAYCELLLLIGVIDLEHRLIPDELVVTGLALALVANVWLRDPGLIPGLLGAAAGGGLFLFLAVVGRNALGVGDVKLAFLIGLMTGFPWVLQALALGMMLGGLAAGLLLFFRIRGPKQYIPYAPYLVVGSLATLLYGPRIALWYASRIGLGG